MARRVLARGINPANPSLFGEDLAPLAVEAGGLSLTAWFNDKIASPFYSQILSFQGDVLAKAADAIGTGLSAWLAGEAVGLLLGHRYGRLVRRGGMILGVGKGISIVLPGFSISGSLPSGFALPSAKVSAQKLLGRGDLPVSTASSTPSLARISGQMGL